jgi:hypothetical protein
MKVYLTLDVTVRTAPWTTLWGTDPADDLAVYVRDELIKQADRLTWLNATLHLVDARPIPTEPDSFTTVRTTWAVLADADAWRSQYGNAFADAVADYLAHVAQSTHGLCDAQGSVIRHNAPTVA